MCQFHEHISFLTSYAAYTFDDHFCQRSNPSNPRVYYYNLLFTNAANHNKQSMLLCPCVTNNVEYTCARAPSRINIIIYTKKKAL